MKDILKYYAKSLSSITQSLKKKSLLIDKPWAMLNDDAQLHKLIFRTKNRLILSVNGVVSEGTWEYIPEAKALLIDRGKDKLLLKEQFIDDNVLIVKKDGTDNDYYALANENAIPDYNVTGYLNAVKCRLYNILEAKLLSGNFIHIYKGKYIKNYTGYVGMYAEQIDASRKMIKLPDGMHITSDRKFSIFIKKNVITDVKKNPVE